MAKFWRAKIPRQVFSMAPVIRVATLPKRDRLMKNLNLMDDRIYITGYVFRNPKLDFLTFLDIFKILKT